TATIPNGHKAPVWTLKDKDGNVYSLDNLRGKVVVMDFWATWCSPCKRVMPEIQKLWDKYKNQNVVIVGINTWEKNGDPVKFMKDNNYNYILLLNGNDVATKYNVSAIPTLYVIDKNGNVAFSEVGAVEGLGESLDRVISNLIKK
ncbi:MAG TPA: TlpA disulfide reductase family protein, partial [Candidatus Kapabacteria bacterium]|nr:TlpA disulfide reductase family protein [Candidatus Kapabacteria bacterium]